MATYIEKTHTAEHILSEAPGMRSREEAVLASGVHPAGTVLALNADDEYVQVAPTAEDTTADAVAVLYADADATSAKVDIVVNVRDCEVHGAALTWPDSITDEQATAGVESLKSNGVIVRD